MMTKLVQSVNEKLLSGQRENQARAFSALEGSTHSHLTRGLTSTWSHQRVQYDLRQVEKGGNRCEK